MRASEKVSEKRNELTGGDMPARLAIFLRGNKEIAGSKPREEVLRENWSKPVQVILILGQPRVTCIILFKGYGLFQKCVTKTKDLRYFWSATFLKGPLTLELHIKHSYLKDGNHIYYEQNQAYLYRIVTFSFYPFLNITVWSFYFSRKTSCSIRD